MLGVWWAATLQETFDIEKGRVWGKQPLRTQLDMLGWVGGWVVVVVLLLLVGGWVVWFVGWWASVLVISVVASQPAIQFDCVPACVFVCQFA